MGLVATPFVDLRDRQIAALEKQLEAMREARDEALEALRLEKSKNAGVELGVRELRAALMPLYRSLSLIYGKIEEVGIGAATPQAEVKNSAVWQSWKEKLGGKAADAIDVLLLHGELTAAQLRLHLKCGNEYVYKIITKLATANLINRREGRVSLKQL